LKKNRWVSLLGVVVFGLFALTVKCLPDPYYHQEKVTLVEWVRRELDELRTGERVGR